MFGTLLQIKLRTKVIVTAPVGPNLVLASPALRPNQVLVMSPISPNQASSRPY